MAVFRVRGYMTSTYTMEVVAESKAEAIRVFDEYTQGGTDWQPSPIIRHKVEKLEGVNG